MIRPQIDDLLALRAGTYPRRSRVAPTAPFPAGAEQSGRHAGLQRGRGLEFAELRAYQPGDDVRAIDWRRTARHGMPCTKLFHAERERVLRVLVDLGPSMHFGTRSTFKSVTAARCATLLAWAAERAGDRVAGLVSQGADWRETPPRARHPGVLALIGLLCATPLDGHADFTAGLQRLAHRVGSADRVVICSDFRSLDAAGEALIAQLARRAECLLVQVHDPFEAVPPPPGRYALTDGTRELVIDFADAAVRRAHAEAFAAHAARLRALAQRCGAHLLDCATDAAPADFLARALG